MRYTIKNISLKNRLILLKLDLITLIRSLRINSDRCPSCNKKGAKYTHKVITDCLIAAIDNTRKRLNIRK